MKTKLFLGALAALGCSVVAAETHSMDAAPGSQPVALADAESRCTALPDVLMNQWPDRTTRVLTAVWHPAGTPLQTPFGPPSALPAHCELTAVMQERTGQDGQHYAVHFRVRLPQHWNGRFLFEGGGGTEGDLGQAVGMTGGATPRAIDSGFAVVAQDAGHDNRQNNDPKRGGTVAFGFDPGARADYGGASLEPVAVAAKAAIASYYGHPPEHSYFYGCSKGGQEGMAFAQRYPEVFDGIVAGAPGFSLPRAALAEAWDTQAFASLVSHGADLDARTLPSSFSDAQFALLREAVLDACDADDGVRDGITSAVGSCTWRKLAPQLNRRRCDGGSTAACLSAAQIGVLQRVLGGPKDSHGASLYSDWPIDAGLGSAGWRSWKIGPAGSSFPGINVAMGAPALAVIFTTLPTALDADPQSALNYALRFDFDKDAPKIYATGGVFTRSAWTDISARSPHLERFRSHGGKLIVPQGASDPVFSLNDTLAWYRELNAIEHGHAAAFARVFPVPGMAHCAGGPATDQFDALGALVDWVERGVAPERILASAGPASPWPGRTRPLCAYPKTARYSGAGSIEDAGNFRCE
ncbi:MAG TPA: tannase/feruloyl esterase family alpha/beta hydrolase [Steroidobacteraceae bacterium]|nr:tannase/feruloyl esterase family alpha/beta hydrolase [Steroidobacteraceae bacterium]